MLEASAESGVEPVFARHETFHPRYGWLKKAYDAAVEQPDVFLRSDAPVVLGVGKNMVRAIRYWAEAFKVLERRPNEQRPRLDDSIPTEFGHSLLCERGWDPYLETRAALWLLHWKLYEPPCIAPSWYATIGSASPAPISAGTLLAELRRFCAEHPEWGEIAENSLKKDARCLLKMYAAVTSGRDLPEDTIDSPFVELGLLRELAKHPGLLHFPEGAKAGLADEVVAYACLRYAARSEPGLIPVARLASERGSPGAVFKLAEPELAESLARCAELAGDGLALTSSAGAAVLVFAADTAALADGLVGGLFKARANAAKKVAA